MKVAYYPGCSLEGTAGDYAASIRGICAALGVELEEVPDWNCCGATAAHSIDHEASIGLCVRTLNLAARMPHRDLVVPCPMCFNRLRTAAWTLEDGEADRYPDRLDGQLPEIRNLPDFFAGDELLGKVSAAVVTPLEGLKVVCYYGCMASRPPEITGEADFENPMQMDRILEALGATVIQWPYKTDCCGASQVLSQPHIVTRLVGRLLDMAGRCGAEAIAVSCQMCQANLDMVQRRVGNQWGRRIDLPILYFSELMGIACQVPGMKRCLKKHITNPFPLLRGLNLIR
jgi:heterodisulfide reductase subunit B